MRGQIVVEIRACVVQRHVVLLEHRVQARGC